jgi:ribosomal protein S18 acetylase RimI-like enzyme
LLLVSLHDRAKLAMWLRSNLAMNAFALCYLDSATWHRTMWLGLDDDDVGLRAVALIYMGPGGTFVNVMGEHSAPIELLASAADVLPRRFHLSLEARHEERVDVPGRTLEHVEDFMRMTPGPLNYSEAPNIVRLSLSAAPRVKSLLIDQGANPSAFFQEHTLESGLYRGWIEAARLVGIVGVHAWSEEQKIAVVGNLAVLPAMRRRGIARALMESIFADLQSRGWDLAFNVGIDNHPALALYQRTKCHEVGLVREYRVS